jgi:DNA adenine methylase
MKSFIGYPGGKSRLAKRLLANYFDVTSYVEPFAGGFSVGLTLLERGKIPVWINDLDKDVVALWKAAIRHTDEFCDLISTTKVSVKTFYTLRERILANESRTILQRAIDKLVVHKLSYGNMGEMSGSPVGGKNQTDAWKFNVRWNPDSICQAVRRVAKMFGDTTITSLSVFDMLPEIPKDALVYLDPPYVTAGGKCYKHAFTEEDHRDLSTALKSVKFNWFMTYDNNPLIKEIYEGQIHEFTLNYQASSAYRKGEKLKSNTELFIRSI